MVGFIQRYNLSASRGAGSSILSANIVDYLCIAVLNQIHSRRPISLKKNPSPKTMEVENRAAFNPIFWHMGRVLEGAVIVVTIECLSWESVVTGCW
ncbi:hypothetical protein NQ094_15885 [Enterobacter kobei]|uniref:hypothetical protein n=1 Tax=Enterobacter kobei TaxID=208224 RepID=UPI00214A309D|nr:hypothetical protein [Enterobacter kobei]EKW5023486.1 hypothetical protein [Klebsiella pneumoniae]MCR2797481.1 hypothetical protein [Enterobacter kobei]